MSLALGRSVFRGDVGCTFPNRSPKACVRSASSAGFGLHFCAAWRLQLNEGSKRLAQRGIHKGRYFFLHCIQKEEGIDSAGDFGESKNRFSLV